MTRISVPIFLLTALLAQTVWAAPVLMPANPYSPPDEIVDPEARLVAALDRLAQGQADIALNEIYQLVEEQPNFRLAQLIYGDLLQIHAGDTDSLKISSRNKRLSALIDEARLRWRQRQTLPDADAIPDVLLRLALREERAVLVDLRAARLYLMWSVGGRPRILEDHYIGIGKYGTGKKREGDQRTPVGIYRITSYLNREMLAEKYDDDAYLYGAGALPINYPNLHDRLLSRTGSGIWLHGVPDETYVRPPRSSRGCVTMANSDFTRLLKEVVPGHTLVIFSDGIEWISRSQAKIRELEIMEALKQWQSDWAAADSDAFFEHYAEDYKTESANLASFVDLEQRARASRGQTAIDIDNLSLMSYPDEKDTFLITFRQAYNDEGLRGFIRKQQYWRKDTDGRWRIIHEGIDAAS